jgi:ribosome small subunit-dependent GTPase A
MRSRYARIERTLIRMSDPATETLDALGWDARLAALADDAGRPAASPGRVVRVDMGLVTVLTGSGTVRATPGDDHVATGDWVLVEEDRVVAVLPRRSVFTRGDPMEGAARGPQVVAANVDVVLIVQSLTSGPNARRLERELVLAFESGATPVVVLNKADLVDEQAASDAVTIAEDVAAGVDVVLVSASRGDGVDRLRALAHGNRTLALIGASGVGKSTLVNALVGSDVQATGDVRESDQRGRHTTTARELVLLPNGGVLVDTPGLRAVSLWDADEGMSRAFADIEELAAQCRFRNCSHTLEPGCAVRAAMVSGELDPARFENYLRLDTELDVAEQKRQARIASKGQRQLYGKVSRKTR